MHRLKRPAEILSARLLPGALNVIVVLLLAQWLTPQKFGLTSTYLATGLAAASLLFGPLNQSALVLHAKYFGDGRQDWFEQKHLSNVLMYTASLLIFVPVAAVSGLFNYRIVAIAAGFGLYTCTLQVLQSRLQFLRFGIASTAQSLALISIAVGYVREMGTINSVLNTYIASYVLGSIVALVLTKVRFLTPSLPLLRTVTASGFEPMLANTAAEMFTLGTRYLLVATGRLDILAVFAFSVDLAQRAVGIIISIVTFAVVPKALKATAAGDPRDLWSHLLRGWFLATAAAAASIGAILFLGATGVIPVFGSSLYNPISFTLVACAVAAARSGKMLLNPVAIRLGKTGNLLTPFLVSSLAALCLVYLGLIVNMPYVAEAGYLAASITGSVGVYLLMRPWLRRTDMARAISCDDR